MNNSEFRRRPASEMTTLPLRQWMDRAIAQKIVGVSSGSRSLVGL